LKKPNWLNSNAVRCALACLLTIFDKLPGSEIQVQISGFRKPCVNIKGPKIVCYNGTIKFRGNQSYRTIACVYS
jgi:hypothetical protein